MLELVDKLRLGRSGRNAVEVRLLLLTGCYTPTQYDVESGCHLGTPSFSVQTFRQRPYYNTPYYHDRLITLSPYIWPSSRSRARYPSTLRASK